MSVHVFYKVYCDSLLAYYNFEFARQPIRENKVLANIPRSTVVYLTFNVSEDNLKQTVRELVPLSDGNMNFSGDALDYAAHALA